jgi:hypothetical protein
MKNGGVISPFPYSLKYLFFYTKSNSLMLKNIIQITFHSCSYLVVDMFSQQSILTNAILAIARRKLVPHTADASSSPSSNLSIIHIK